MTETLLDLENETIKFALSKLGLTNPAASNFNFATISKTIGVTDYVEYWILANAEYDENIEKFVKIDVDATSYGIQLQAKGEVVTGLQIWRNPKKSEVIKDLSVYDYSGWDDYNYIGAEKLSNQEWVEFDVSSGWNLNFSSNSKGELQVGGKGIEIDGTFPYSRITNSMFNDGNDNYYLNGILENAKHPDATWDCDSNNNYAFFMGLKTKEVNGVRDGTSTKFVVMQNNMVNANGNTMDISDWLPIFEVDANGIKAIIDGTLTQLEMGVVDEIEEGNMNAVSSNAVYQLGNGLDISIVKQQTAEQGYAHTYVLYQGNTALSPKINIPKDFLVKSATVETCEEDDVPVEGYRVGDKYLDFIVNTIDSDETPTHIYVLVSELGHEYDGDNSTIVLGEGNIFSIKDGGVTYAKISQSAIGTGSNQIASGNHTHSNYLEKTQTDNKGKNVVVDNTTGEITFETKPTIPIVVDTVENGNSNAVTSNATYDTFSDVLDELLSEGLFISGDSVVQSGGSAVINVRLYGAIGVTKSIAFYRKNTGGTDTLLGSVSTDNGFAQYIYSATGAGKREIYAKTGVIQSETYEITDCYKYDKGAYGTGNHTDIWTVSNGNLTRVQDADYSELAETGENNASAYFSSVPHTDFCIEFDFYQVDGTTSDNYLTIFDSNWTLLSYKRLNQDSLNIGEWNTITVNVTDVATGSIVRLITTGTMSKLRFKNFKLYPI